jgi:hypothetical protein
MKANLESAGIPAQITNENLQGAYCLDGMVPGVSVPTSHAEQAKQIIKEIQQSSKDEQEQSLPRSENMMKTKAYFSYPKWNDSFVGRYIWIYKGQGTLELVENLLIYTTERLKIEINKEKIIEINLGRYHRTAKPITLNFIDIKYKNEDSEEKRIFFTPISANKNPWLTPAWTANVHVKKCLEKVNEWKNT